MPSEHIQVLQQRTLPQVLFHPNTKSFDVPDVIAAPLLHLAPLQSVGVKQALRPVNALKQPREAIRVLRAFNTRFDELDELMVEIYVQLEFKDLLLPPSEGDMQAAAKCGPIVITNISEYRRDANLVDEVENKEAEAVILSSICSFWYVIHR